MTAVDIVRAPSRTSLRRYLVASPAHVEVAYAINPWMDPTVPFDPERAQAQWRVLVATLTGLGHRVDVLPPLPGLPLRDSCHSSSSSPSRLPWQVPAR